MQIHGLKSIPELYTSILYFVNPAKQGLEAGFGL